jgi:predicted ATP-grasp superfamily ATP-dependent carboligase
MTRVVIVGPSVRAAAFSAVRAGFTPWCLDQFADRDLARIASVQRLAGAFPEAIEAAFQTLPLPAQTPWLYTGGLENHPRILRRLQQLRPQLWGNDAVRVRRVRDRHWLAERCREVGLEMPPEGSWPPGPGRWLVKPVSSAGGRGIRPWSDTEPSKLPAGWYVQRWCEGVPVGVIFVGRAEQTVFLGATRQLVGLPYLGGGPYAYQGSVGPLRLPASVQQALTELARQLDLRGLFGIDGLLDGERFWVLEVNPRYTASVEVLEYAGSFVALAWHRSAWETATAPLRLPDLNCIVAKAIVYAKRDLVFPAAGPWDVALRQPVTSLPTFADIPAGGEPISAGAPICTLFATAASSDAALAQMEQRVKELRTVIPDP